MESNRRKLYLRDTAADSRLRDELANLRALAPTGIDSLSDVSISSPVAGQALKYNGSVWINDTDATGGGGVSDGDKGDIVVSGTGAVWTIDTGAVSTSKMGGDVTAAGKALLDDADAAAQRTTLGLGTAATAASGDFAAASHTHTASAISDFSEAVDDRIATLLVAGTNVTLTYDDVANTLTVAATGGGGGGGLTQAQTLTISSLGF